MHTILNTEHKMRELVELSSGISVSLYYESIVQSSY